MRGKSLALQVKEFILPALAQNVNDTQREIVTPYSKPAKYLNKVEERLHGMVLSQNIPELLRPEAIKRKREPPFLYKLMELQWSSLFEHKSTDLRGIG